MTVERLTVDQVAGKVAIRLRHLGSGALQSWLRGRARVGCGLAAVVMATLAPVVMAVDASPRRVLMVYSFGRDFMPYAATGIQFRSELARLSPQPVEFRDASLEQARFDAPGRDGPLLDYLRAVYAEHRPDLIVPIGAQAAMFLQRHRQELFPEAPLLLVGVDDRRLRGMLSEPGVTSVGLDMDVSRFVGNILEVRPNTRDIYVVIGTSPLEKFWEQAFRREWAQFSDRVTLHWWSDLSIAEVRESARNLPPDSAVLVTVVNLDVDGIPFEHEAALRSISPASSAPVFGIIREQLGLGIVGGRLVSQGKIGFEAAKHAVRLLAGEPAANLPVQQLTLDPPAYDWRELKRWGISESSLPLGSEVLYRSPGLWEEYRGHVLIALGIMALQAVLILLLLAARRRARESDANLSLAAESGNVGLWQLATGSDEVKATPKFRSLFGLPPSGRITVEDILDRIHPDDRSDTEKAIQNAVNDVEDFSVEHRMVLPDVGLRWIASTGHAEVSREGRPARVRGASIDITAIRKAEMERQSLRTELAHLSRVSTMGQLSSALAHELNQPLGAILRNAEAAELLLEQEPTDWDELKAILKDIQQDEQRAVSVIDRMRSLLKKRELQIEPISLDRVVHLVIGLLKSELQFRRVHLAVELESGLPWVRGDAIHLQQVMLNLLANALDAIRDVPSERRRVAVRAKRLESNRVEVAVCDRGTGIPEERLQRVFEPFVSTKANGMGMGLAICRSIVETHGGRLWAENNPEGGATVRFTLIAVQEATQK